MLMRGGSSLLERRTIRADESRSYSSPNWFETWPPRDGPALGKLIVVEDTGVGSK